MKKRKFNILLNIAVLCMCVCAIAIGVYSAKTASLNVSGTIGFTAHNCKVRVLGKITGAVDASNNAITSNTSTATINYTDSSNTSQGKLIDGTADTWTFGSIFFDDLNTDKYHEVNDIVFTFTITNESAYYVDVTVNQKCSNNDRIFIYAPNNGETLSPQGQEGSSVTLTVKLQLQKVNGEYSSLGTPINLSNATLLNFTKSQAPSYLATNWVSKIGFSKSAVKSISFVNVIDESIKSNSSYTQIKVGAVNATSAQSDLTNNTSVTDVVAYYNSTNKEIIVYSPARIYAPQNCSSMFSGFSRLTSLNLRNFDTSNVTNMSSMFNQCGGLTSLDVRNFDTSSVENMSSMFSGCGGLTSLDVSNFNTSKVTNMSTMFNQCSVLDSLDASNFNTSKVTNMSSMFSNCISFINLNLRNFDTSSVIDMSRMFNNYGGTSLDVSNFNTSNVENMSNMFYISSLTSLDVSNFDTSSVENMSSMFASSYALTSLDLSNFDTSRVTDMSDMFSSSRAFTSLDLSNFDTSSVTKMNSMFAYCSELKTIYVNSSKWSTANVTNSSSMFSSCTKLPNFNSSVVDKTNAHTGAKGYLTEKA